MNTHKTTTDNHPIDQRLVALYNEYLENDEEKEFIWMLYEILDMATPEIKARVARSHRYLKMKESKRVNKTTHQMIEDFFGAMTVEERIKFLNTPWADQPDWIKENLTKLVKYPEEFNFLRIAGEVSESSRQKEVFGARLLRYMEKYRFITSDEEGTKLDYKRFCEVCNTLAEKYDLASRPGKRAQITRITPADLKSYTQERVTPKKDKLTTIAVAMNVPVAYLGGYGSNTPPTSSAPLGGKDPEGNGPFSGKFRKNRMA